MLSPTNQTPWSVAHNSAEYHSSGVKSLRTRNDHGVSNSQPEEERGGFSNSKFPSGIDKDAAIRIEREWLKNPALYDEMLTNTNKYYEAFGIWKNMKYSKRTVSSAMKGLGKDKKLIKYIKTGYKNFLENVEVR
ncbi:hypothetical protein F443_22328 [Phytophthora nicotianae P1569]|uniref:Uncharacterized protein n=2 Tax=Phytophthora nicotianae TaxID=4792 RepID=V9DUK0_PHYNI|nr:hypothetical protein F443_22328 [Phytophthora nicotianae P1569]